MDVNLNIASEMPEWPGHGGSMPPESPLDMPLQALHRRPEPRFERSATARTALARVLTWGIALAITAHGVREMLAIVGYQDMTVLQGIMIVFFTITLGWIGFAAASACAALLPLPRARHASAAGTRTALLMPVYHEDPTRTTAALRAMAEALEELGRAAGFEIVVVSDSTRADEWIRETLAVDALRAALIGVMPVHYRRRWRNVARKVGNIEDFVKRWGGRYDYMVVLDADSLMAGATLVQLVERMHADPELGLLQTVPVVAGQSSLFARMQQFAGRVHGGIVGRGVASWSGDEGNYWGHNAIIRVRAFAECCGLPELPGRTPFGGHVLSHDFIEAAFLRRRGWKVRMANELGGSWEETPPSLADVAIRDRRWAQGNLQHLKFLTARGLAFTSRVHLVNGMMSYLASPLWLALILVGFALSLQAHLIRPEYFGDTFQLFPDWPVFDAERMISLFVFSMCVLITPKLLGTLRALLNRDLRRGCGGILGVLVSTVVELALSALYAPIMMVIHSRHVFDILTGRDSGWSSQRRGAARMSWAEALARHWMHTAFGAVIALAAFLLSPALLAWVSPAVTGLVLAIPLSRISGSERAGRMLERLGLLRIPEETRPPRVMAHRNALAAGAERLPADALRYLAQHASARFAHIAGNLARPADVRGRPDPHRLLAQEKIEHAHSLDEALGWLTAEERVEVAADVRLLARLANLAQHAHGMESKPGGADAHSCA
jgi:membrane glycosyltransferase